MNVKQIMMKKPATPITFVQRLNVPTLELDGLNQSYHAPWAQLYSRDTFALVGKLVEKGVQKELAAEMGLDPKKIQWITKVSWLPLSLESPVGEDEVAAATRLLERVVRPTMCP